MATRILKALCVKFPNCKIYWLTQQNNFELLEDNPNLDHVIKYPGPEWKFLWREREYKRLYQSIIGFIKKLRSYHFDWAFDLHRILKSALCVYLSGAKVRVGSQSKGTEAESLLASIGIKGDFVVLCPFTVAPQKHWHAERWEEKAKKLHEHYSLDILMKLHSIEGV